MLSSVSRAGNFKRLSPIFLTSNLIECTGSQGVNSQKLIRGYSSFYRSNNCLVAWINRNISNFYHRSVITESSFQVTPTKIVESELNSVEFEKISDDTLDSLAEYFDGIVERAEHLPEADVSYGDGVLTIKFGDHVGTYVINRQSPNKQIWLSSPKSGPKRYDFINNTWIYKHDGNSLHQLLDDEISLVVNEKTEFVDNCAYSREKKK
ncbi:frataxin homolog, mitochondrial [Fopius arisanus]|uniref:ferroxidase n=1 Tax=Fopius arisanus TaxID=64838 RepID=A0A9R1TAB1_9HYME|nr:PREDICTED: frataxin homolog, mitochondrial [Fopius arisanus]